MSEAMQTEWSGHHAAKDRLRSQVWTALKAQDAAVGDPAGAVAHDTRVKSLTAGGVSRYASCLHPVDVCIQGAKEMDVRNVQALIFDVFGTVVDWRSSIIKHGEQFGKRYGVAADWDAFADAWRGKYRPFMDKVRNGALPWTNLDGLHRIALEEVLSACNITGISDDAKAEFNLAWHDLSGGCDRGPPSCCYRMPAVAHQMRRHFILPRGARDSFNVRSGGQRSSQDLVLQAWGVHSESNIVSAT